MGKTTRRARSKRSARLEGDEASGRDRSLVPKPVYAIRVYASEADMLQDIQDDPPTLPTTLVVQPPPAPATPSRIEHGTASVFFQPSPPTPSPVPSFSADGLTIVDHGTAPSGVRAHAAKLLLFAAGYQRLAVQWFVQQVGGRVPMPMMEDAFLRVSSLPAQAQLMQQHVRANRTDIDAVAMISECWTLPESADLTKLTSRVADRSDRVDALVVTFQTRAGVYELTQARGDPARAKGMWLPRGDGAQFFRPAMPDMFG